MSESPSQDFSKPQLIVINDNNDGQRIDNYLTSCLKGVPKTRIYRILRKGEVRVNKGRIKPHYRLKKGDIVRIPPLNVAKSGEKPVISQEKVKQIRDRILFENDDLLVIDKPAGLAVHGGSGLAYGVIDIARVLRPETSFLELVHRLDRETSGCLMLAKNRPILLELHELIKEGKVEKKYLAGLKGNWQGGNQTVSAPLKKNTLRGGERIVEVSPDGKPAVTHFSVVEQYPGLSLMEVTLETGRTHQIRVHSAYSGHPIAGDTKYGDEAFNKQMKQMGLKRLFLHAHYLSFVLPRSGNEITVSAPLASELQDVLTQLEGS